MSSWQPPKTRFVPTHLDQQQRQPARHAPRNSSSNWAYLLMTPRFFQLVNLRVDLLEPFRVVGGDSICAGLVRDFLKRVLVNVHRLHLIYLRPKTSRIGIGACPACLRRSYRFSLPKPAPLRRDQRVHLARVVHAIGHQNHDLAFRLQFAQPVQTPCSTRPRWPCGRVDRADFHPIQISCKKSWSSVRGVGDICLRRKHDQPDAVIRRWSMNRFRTSAPCRNDSPAARPARNPRKSCCPTCQTRQRCQRRWP